MQRDELRRLRIYSDGSSRGNPGPAAASVMIVGEEGVTVKKFSRYLGYRTNNEAEYEALISALEVASRFTKGYVDCFLDSQLVVKQLTGEYQVRNVRLAGLQRRVRELQQHFRGVSFNHVLRNDKNIEEVDRLAKRVIDKALQ